jgi:molecular chaperone GrpE
LEMIRDNLWNKLKNEGVREVKVEEKKDVWNSRFHEFYSEEVNDDLPDKTVLEVVEKGYSLFDQILKPAKVKISRNKS